MRDRERVGRDFPGLGSFSPCSFPIWTAAWTTRPACRVPILPALAERGIVSLHGTLHNPSCIITQSHRERSTSSMRRANQKLLVVMFGKLRESINDLTEAAPVQTVQIEVLNIRTNYRT